MKIERKTESYKDWKWDEMVSKIEFPPLDSTGRKNPLYYEYFPVKPGV